MKEHPNIKPRGKTVLILLILLSVVSFILYGNKYSSGRKDKLHVVNTESGRVAGIQSGTPGVTVFKGIPYAIPPVGKLRWQAPQPPEKWGGVLKADHFSHSCMQAPQQQQLNPPGARRKSVWTKPFLIPDRPPSENCLDLNIWTAADSSSGQRPVIVWIHGGGFQSGSGSVPVYNGEAMAQKGVVFVTINYRVGIFGFLALPQLSKETSPQTSGNYGLLDQIAALRWVNENIKSFGGNPDNITIAGQSAGAFSVNYLVASPLAKGLFQRAIAESGGSLVSNPFNSTLSLKEAEKRGLQLMKKASIGSVERLRALPADSLFKMGGGFSPNIDGYVLPDKISTIFSEGKQNDVPTLMGWNTDEGTAFSIYSKPPNAKTFRKQAGKTYGKEAEEFLSYYPAKSDSQARVSQYALSRDLLFGVQNYAWANLQSKTGNSDVFIYTFDRKLPARDTLKFFGAFHSGEIAYALDNLRYLDRPWQTTDKKLANIMSSYWINFAATGNPNAKGLSEWPAYRPGEKTDMELGADIGIHPIPNKKALNFLISYFRTKSE